MAARSTTPWIRRQLIDIGEVVVNNAFGAPGELDGKAQIELAESELFRLAKDGGSPSGFVTFELALTEAIKGAERAFKNAGHVSGLSTGLRDLDKKTGGMHPSDLIILAGRPGMGKTALATKIAFGAARALQRDAEDRGPDHVAKGSVAIFSLEMSSEQLATRLLAEEARVSGDRIRRGEIGQKDFDRFIQVSREIAHPTAAYRRHPGAVALGHADPVPPAAADPGAEPGGGRLPTADAALGRHQAGEPGPGDQPDHPGAEGAGQGDGDPGDRAVAALPLGREPRGQAAATGRSA